MASADQKVATTEAELIARIRSGDESAMAMLYDRYSGLVYAVALRVVADTGAAEDVLQDIFMQLWRNPGAFNAARGRLAPWLAVIARNRAIDHLRKRRPETELEDVVVAVEPDLADGAFRAQVVERVRGELAAMPAEQRKCLELAFFEGLTHSEIATRTGEPLGTVKTRIRSGLIALRKTLA